MFDFSQKQLKSRVPVRWHAMVEYALYLHEGSMHAPHLPLPFAWHDGGREEGMLYFGVLEATMAALDLLFVDPKFACEQVYNILSLQTSDGFIPSRLIFSNDLNTKTSQLAAPGLWPWIIELILQVHPHFLSKEDLHVFYYALEKQLLWLEKSRRNSQGGFFHLDIHDGFCESGYGLELRFLSGDREDPIEEDSCVDATSQAYYMYNALLRLADQLNINNSQALERQEFLQTFIQKKLYDPSSRFFYDQWHFSSEKINTPLPISYLGLWPVICQSASSEQALNIIRDYLLNPQQLYCIHPLAGLSQQHPSFAMVGWLGPVRNSQLLWLVLGLKNYGLAPTIAHLLERALEHTADQFVRTQTLWECYHPYGSHPQEIIKLSGDDLLAPSGEHICHNPVIAMSYLLHELRSVLQ